MNAPGLTQVYKKQLMKQLTRTGLRQRRLLTTRTSHTGLVIQRVTWLTEDHLRTTQQTHLTHQEMTAKLSNSKSNPNLSRTQMTQQMTSSSDYRVSFLTLSCEQQRNTIDTQHLVTTARLVPNNNNCYLFSLNDNRFTDKRRTGNFESAYFRNLKYFAHAHCT